MRKKPRVVTRWTQCGPPPNPNFSAFDICPAADHSQLFFTTRLRRDSCGIRLSSGPPRNAQNSDGQEAFTFNSKLPSSCVCVLKRASTLALHNLKTHCLSHTHAQTGRGRHQHPQLLICGFRFLTLVSQVVSEEAGRLNLQGRVTAGNPIRNELQQLNQMFISNRLNL